MEHIVFAKIITQNAFNPRNALILKWARLSICLNACNSINVDPICPPARMSVCGDTYVLLLVEL